MVGCKFDLVDQGTLDKHEQTALEIIEQESWKKFSAIHCFCSAKDNINIDDVFVKCAEFVLRSRSGYDDGHNDADDRVIDLNGADNPPQAKKCC